MTTAILEVLKYHRHHESMAQRRAADDRVSPHSKHVWELEAELHRFYGDAVEDAMKQLGLRAKPRLADAPAGGIRVD